MSAASTGVWGMAPLYNTTRCGEPALLLLGESETVKHRQACNDIKADVKDIQ